MDFTVRVLISQAMGNGYPSGFPCLFGAEYFSGFSYEQLHLFMVAVEVSYFRWED